MPGHPHAVAARAILQIAFVWLAVRAFWMASELSWVAREMPIFDALLKVAIWVAPSLGLYALAARCTPRRAWRDLGLGGAPWRSAGFALAATAPMAIALVFTPMAAADVDALIDAAIVGPFAEEVLFRGFLCLQLVRLAGWRIWPAIVVSSAMFALAHLPHVDLWILSVSWPGMPVSGASARYPYLAPYALGGALFGWIAWRWQSLWPAIGLHACMNLWWVLAEGGSRLEFGVTPMTIGHALAIAAAIALTLRVPRQALRPARAEAIGRAGWDRLARPDTL